ncbi:MAG: TonB family protein [Bacteroides sp.]|nr:TonB family protein [Bacteroides sp.]
MGTFFVYILKSAFCLALFYLFYRLLLSRETFHRFNRVALLCLLVLSCVVPLIEVGSEGVNEINRQFLSWEEMLLMSELQTSEVAEAETVLSWGWKEVLLLVYLIGIVFFLVRTLWSLARMFGLLDGCKKECLEDGIYLFVHEKEIAPFSWMKFIVLSKKDCEEGGEAILTHERAHIHHLHSWDLLLADVCVFFQWFNPAAWLLKQELQNIHEYEADEWVINQGIDAKRYQLLLIKKAVGTRLYSMANNLNHSSLKKRITMMIKKKSNPWARLKYLYILPLAAASVAAFARPEVSNSFEEISSVKVSDLASIMKADGEKSVENLSPKKVKVAGKVIEEKNGKPVTGASIIIRGTTNGTLAIDGKFSIEANEGDVLVVSFIGLQTQSVIVPKGGSESMVISMKEEVQNLEEMVIVGYAPQDDGVIQVTSVKKEEETPALKADEEQVVFQVVEEMPSFPGGMNECMMFLAKNMKYPVAAQQAKIEGRVIVQFVVDRDGSIKDAQVVRSVSPELDAEAVRVIGLMPKWNPGKQRGKAVAVKYTMPVMFRLQKQQEPQVSVVNLKVDKDMEMGTVTEVKDYLRKGYVTRINYEKLEEGETNPLVKNGIVLRGENPDKKPIVVVDGEFKGYGSEVLSTLNPVDIESISVLKDKTGIEKFGELGKNGVILVTTKKNK